MFDSKFMRNKIKSEKLVFIHKYLSQTNSSFNRRLSICLLAFYAWILLTFNFSEFEGNKTWTLNLIWEFRNMTVHQNISVTIRIQSLISEILTLDKERWDEVRIWLNNNNTKISGFHHNSDFNRLNWREKKSEFLCLNLKEDNFVI